jgi:2-methylisocitrate lyase-like PEP mutase family enzyme
VWQVQDSNLRRHTPTDLQNDAAHAVTCGFTTPPPNFSTICARLSGRRFTDLAVERVGAARRAIDESGTGIVLTGRSEGFVVGRPDIDETIRRLRAYAAAGADCLYAPRIDKPEHVAAIDSAVSPKPVNLLINAPFTTVAEAAQVGVRRISVGGTLARTAWGGFLQAAREIADEGTFSRFERLPNVDALFGR